MPRVERASIGWRRRAERPWRAWLARTLAGPRGVPVRAASGVAIVKLDRLGDFVLALGAVRRLLAHFGGDSLLVVSPVAEPLAAREFPSVPRLVLPASQGHGALWGVARTHRARLGQVEFSQSACLRHQRWDYDELVLSWLRAGRHWRVEDGFTRRLRPELKTYDVGAAGRLTLEEIPASPQPFGERLACRELLYHALVVAGATGTAVTAADVMPCLEANGGGTSGAPIVVTPLGSERIRDFPASLLTEALRAARRCVTAPILLTGTPAQREQLAALYGHVTRAGISSVTWRSDLVFDDYLNAVLAAPIVVTADTATAHLATAADRPAIIVLGGGHYGQFGPWRRSRRQQWLTHPVACFGCDWRCTQPGPICLTALQPEQLRLAIAQALEADA